MFFSTYNIYKAYELYNELSACDSIIGTSCGTYANVSDATLVRECYTLKGIYRRFIKRGRPETTKLAHFNAIYIN